MASDKKILLCTVYKNNENQIYDWFEANTRHPLTFTIKRILSFGLRFIKQNIPEIEILEYPTWNDYVKNIDKEKWDVVGFSFYLNEIPEILEMVKYARKAKIPEIWAGNYGALTTEIQDKFDRVFDGYSEYQIANLLNHNLQDIIHPPLIQYLGTTLGFKLQTYGLLFTSRGCSIGCDFCQTPAFCPKPYHISLESIERVLDYYKKNNIDEVLILEENFGLLKKHTEDVVRLLGEKGFYWYAMTKVNFLKKNLDFWIDNGFGGGLIGIESFNQETLDRIGKNQKSQDCIDIVKELHRKNRMIIGYYMLGFENDTKQSIIQDIKKLAKLKMDVTQLCILTPLPKTKQWDYIEKKYGILDKNWHHYDAKYLVWNHPNISPVEMKKLLNWSFKKCYSFARPFEMTIKFHRMYKTKENNGPLGGIKRFIKSSYKANKYDYFPSEIPIV